MDGKKQLIDQKAKKLVDLIYSGDIKKDNRPNHGVEFSGGYEQLHKERFHDYLGSCSRYLQNQRLCERGYHG